MFLGAFGFLVIAFAIFGLGLWAAIDASAKPQWAFERAGQSKTLWILLPLLGSFLCGIVGIVSAVVWFASVRSKVVAAAQGVTPLPGAGFTSLPPASAPPAGWYPDPRGRHEHRYFDGASWTATVSDAGTPGTDPV